MLLITVNQVHRVTIPSIGSATDKKDRIFVPFQLPYSWNEMFTGRGPPLSHAYHHINSGSFRQKQYIVALYTPE
ncbi:hypothetical protein BDV23DRAFT_149815 [Aspergillus alliaceus]|uniref:Uncharacterized protein n=1 Tax=Petromyces alliaceus TaxID=209559 RepID=A0A5N7CH96_PETAA|nr:hypothetical protein BDV23DRAFT_149815 [Aspergillus alliaceus]